MKRAMKKLIGVAALAVVSVFVVARVRANDSLLPVGATAPEVAGKDAAGTSFKLSALKGHVAVVYFYPKDETPGCTREAHNFQRDQAHYAQNNAVVLGVSVDSVDSHKKFCAKEGLNFKLLADTSGEVTKEYGSLTNMGVVKFAARHTFVIDPAGKIARVYTNVDPARHSDEVLAALDQLQKRPAPSQ